jgi:predicted DNA-binding transcriptional regulator YafY
MRRADRLFRIVQQLRRRRVTTAERLAEELGVSPRTIYRDMRDLAASGVPIDGEAGVGYGLPRGFDLPPLMFREDEVAALVLGARMVATFSDPDLARAAESVLEKVEAVLPERVRGRVKKTSLFAKSFRKREHDKAHFAPIRRAIDAQRKIAFAYTRADGAASERTVAPLGLFFWGHGWSVAAWCDLRDAFRSFRLDRMADLRVTDERFEELPGRTLADYFRAAAEECG